MIVCVCVREGGNDTNGRETITQTEKKRFQFQVLQFMFWKFVVIHKGLLLLFQADKIFNIKAL